MNVMAEVLLSGIQEQEKKGTERKKTAWDTHFHIMPPVGWLNDPNGLCYYQGKYHFFFQYAPFDAKGGLKFWGHMTSTDMLHWSYQGVPLFPDSPYDCHGVYSGSAFTEDGKLELFYTGNVKLDGNFDYIHDGREANVIYTGSHDGIHFDGKKCLLTSLDYPKGYTRHVRDPKVFRENGQYYMVLGGRKNCDKGAVMLYESTDKLQWKFKEEFTTERAFGYMWECPDLFLMGQKRVLSVSPQGLQRETYKNQNIYQSGYFFIQDGEIDPDTFTEWDMGFDFYAPQTFMDPKGRRILVGWAGLPDVDGEYVNPTTALGWQHVLTTPRELSVKNGKVVQTPVEEIETLRKSEILVERGLQTEIPGGCFDLELTGLGGAPMRIVLEKDCIIRYEDGIFSLAFEESGGTDIGCGRRIRRAKTGHLEDVRIISDGSLLEIYVNGGETVFTTRYYPDREMRSICVDADGTCRLYELAL